MLQKIMDRPTSIHPGAFGAWSGVLTGALVGNFFLLDPSRWDPELILWKASLGIIFMYAPLYASATVVASVIAVALGGLLGLKNQWPVVAGIPVIVGIAALVALPWSDFNVLYPQAPEEWGQIAKWSRFLGVLLALPGNLMVFRNQ